MKGSKVRVLPALALSACLVFLSGISFDAAAQTGVTAARGELLYTTYCVACHNARVHWREQKLATDWNSLLAQVRRWQAVQKLGWDDDSVTEVARYLNSFYYDYPEPGEAKR